MDIGFHDIDLKMPVFAAFQTGLDGESEISQDKLKKQTARPAETIVSAFKGRIFYG